MCESSVVIACRVLFFFKQKTAYEMRISDWSSDVCSSDLLEYDKLNSLASETNRKLLLDEDKEAEKKAFISYKLVSLKDDAPVTDGLDALTLGPVEWPKLAAFLDLMEFRTLKARIENRLKLRDRKSTRLNSSH